MARDGVHGDTRYAQLFFAGGIELDELCDSLKLPQEPRGVEAPLIHGGRRPRQLGGPANLAFDFLDELPDFCGCAFGLLALDADQRRSVVLIKEPDLKKAVGKQNDTNDREKQRDIFAE